MNEENKFYNVLNCELVYSDELAEEIYQLENKAYEHAAGFDLRACFDYDEIRVLPQSTKLVNTGLKIWIKNPNIVGLIYPRSGLGCTKGINLGNSVGVIDADYQGELKVCLFNRTQEPFVIKHGDKIAQLVLTPIIHPNFNIVSEFSNKTQRNEKGFGSSG